MVKNFKLIIQYDGGGYHGWQRQKNLRTVQGEIENALLKMTAEKISLIGSGRTDAGVHALGQVANFRCDTTLTAEIFQKGLNSLIREDTVITMAEQVPEEFHSRFDAKSKVYHYRILNRPLHFPVGRQYAWHIRKDLDLEAMRSAIEHILGSYDFKAFEGTGSPRAHTVRTVMHADIIQKSSGYYIIRIQADGFLRYMVRNIVGTLVEVGLEKMTPDQFQQVRMSKDRGLGGATAPAQGLFLMNVNY